MKGICHRKERGGARACAAQIAANGVPVNARQHPKSSPLAFLSAGVANPTPLGAKLSKTLIFQKEVFPNLFLNFPPLLQAPYNKAAATFPVRGIEDLKRF